VPQNRLAHQVVADRYELLETAGRGGFGVVWRACDTLLQRHVAVKEIHIPGFLNDEDRAGLREKVLKEARAAARLDHPGAVTVFDVIDDDGHPVIVMELVEAPNLRELVQEQGPLAPAEAARIGLEVLEVLDAAHRHGIVHRDVKPGNVMVAESGRVRLGDFGVAAILDDPTVTTSGAITGSPAYMAPEQATNKGAVPASDLWSLGATLYFAVEGRPPFDKGAPLPTLTSIVQDPPRPPERAGALGPVLEGLLVKDPEARLSSAQLRRQLERVSATEPVAETAPGGDTMVLPPPVVEAEEPVAQAAPPPPAPPPAPAPPPVTRRPPATAAPRRSSSVVAWAVGIVAILVVALLAFVLSNRNSDNPSDTASNQTPTTAAGDAPRSTAAGSKSTATTARGGAAASSGDRVAYTDPQTGFTIAYPKGWSIRTDGTLTDFRDPDTGAYLRVDHIEPPGPSPEGAWFELEKSFAAENDNYQRIRIEPTTYNGYRAGTWEFTYTSGGAQLHVVDLGFITPRYGFALYFQTRAGDWDRMQSTFQAFKDSFKAPA
jgi:eukaryotic-like serine/threonine-protein kinase